MTPTTGLAPSRDTGARAPAPAHDRPATPPAGPRAARTRLLLEGRIVPTLLRLAAPNVVVNVVLIAVTASVDAHFVGRMGPSALAGLSLVFPLLMLMQQIANATMGGAIASAVARAMGAGRRDDAAALVVHGLVIAGAMAALFTAGALVAGPSVYAVMGGEGAVLAAAVEYSNAIFAGAVAFWALGALTSVVRGVGQPGVLAAVYTAAEALHVLLVPALAFGVGPVPPMGITGAAVATVTSFLCSSAALAWYVASGRTPLAVSRRAVRLERRLFAEILAVGAPMSLQPVLNNVALAALTAFVATLGPTALAAFGAGIRLEYVLYPLAFGLGAGVLALVGTNVGAGQTVRATRIAWTAAALGAGLTATIGALALAWPRAWVTLFSASEAVQVAGAAYLGVASLGYVFVGLGLPLSSAFQAAARPLWPLLAVAGRVFVVAAGGWVAVHAAGAGLVGLAAVSALGGVAYGATLALAFSGGAWRSAIAGRAR